MLKKYTLTEFQNITFNGFNFALPEETINIISELSIQVGSPSYIKTPVFQKREITDIKENREKDNKKKRNKAYEVVNDEDWDSIRSFQTTKIEKKEGINANIDIIRSYLNKMTDKNYLEMRDKILATLDEINKDNDSDENIMKISNIIFEIATTNRFYSKIYAELYSYLMNKYETMKIIFETSLNSFIELFKNIEYVDPNENYDKYCKINKDNEKRKSLSMFFVNLSITGVICKTHITSLIKQLFDQLILLIEEENKKNEVDEIAENIAILFDKNTMSKFEYSVNIEKDSYKEFTLLINYIEFLSKSKVKDFKSLSSKTIFKFMDIIEK